MVGTFLRIAWRNLYKDRAVALLNFAGLSLGMAGGLLLLLNIHFEYSVDQFHKNKDRIYKVYCRQRLKGVENIKEAEAALLAVSLKASYPQIDQVTRVSFLERDFNRGNTQLRSSGYSMTVLKKCDHFCNAAPGNNGCCHEYAV